MTNRRKVCLLFTMLAVILSACRGVNVRNGNGGINNDATSGFNAKDEIVTVTRESGSGTRGAFVELFGIEERLDNGFVTDRLTDEAITIQSTAVMMSTVEGNKNAIGYISLGSLNDTVKAIKIDNVEVTAENIRNGSYEISRPFLIATKEGLTGPAADFISFIMSKEGQGVVSQNGYVPIETEEAYSTNQDISGRFVIAGSSSVAPVMEKIKEAYEEINGNVTVELQQTDSSMGITAVAEGICDIGMSSRKLRESELAGGLEETIFAMDGIVVIVNNVNPAENFGKEEVREIFMGERLTWE